MVEISDIVLGTAKFLSTEADKEYGRTGTITSFPNEVLPCCLKSYVKHYIEQ